MTLGRRSVGAMVSVAAGVCLYWPLRSGQFDLNGIAEARAFDLGNLFSQNHMLYRVCAFLLKGSLQILGLHVHSIALMQLMTAFFGAVALGAVYLAIFDLTADWRAASAGTAWLATSFSFWYFSTDISYIVPAASVAAIGLALVVRLRSPILVGAVAALAVLIWQANLFLVPFLALAPVVMGLRDGKRKYGYSLVLLGTCVLILSAAYAVIGVFVRGFSRISEVIVWATDYGGAHLPMWGRMGLERFTTAAHSAGASIFPLESRLGVGELPKAVSSGSPHYGLALTAFLGLCLWPLILMLWRANRKLCRTPFNPDLKANDRRIALWLIAGYLLFIPFIVWWDPGESKWFAVPNIFLAAVIGVLWSRVRWTSADRIVAVAGILTIALSNFSATIRPRRFSEGAGMKIARCVAQHMRPEDIFVSYDWSWDGYLSYLYGRNSISLIGNSSYFKRKEDFLDAINSEVSRVQGNGGNVYAPDLESYSSGYLDWLQSQTGLSRAELARFSSAPSFSCAGLSVRRLALLPGVVPKSAFLPAREVPLEAGSDQIYVAKPPGPSPLLIGYGHLKNYGGQALMIVANALHGSLLSEAVLPALPAIEKGRIYVDDDSHFETAIAIANPSDRKARFLYRFIDDAGHETGKGEFELSPGSQIARFLSQSPFFYRKERKSALNFQSTAPVAVLAMQTAAKNNGEIVFSNSPLSRNKTGSDGMVLLLPQISGGQAYRDELILLNSGWNTLSGTIGERPAVAFRVLPGSFCRMELSEHSGKAHERIVVKPSDESPAAFVVRKFTQDNSVTGQTTIPVAGKGSFFRMYVEHSPGFGRGGAIRTLLVVYNPTERETAVKFQLIGLSDSTRVAAGSVILPGGGQECIDLSKLPAFPQLASGFLGLMEMSANPSTELYATAYRVISAESGDIFNSLPASEAGLQPPIDRFFPHVPVGEGYQVRFLFSKAEERSSKGQLSFFRQDGNPLELLVSRQITPDKR